MIRKKQHITALCGMMLLLTVLGGLPAVNAQEPPVADANGPYIADECEPLFFDASASYSPEGGTMEYRWDFDGTWTDWYTYPYAEYIWRDDFQGTITLEVRANGLTDQDTTDVTVFNTAPYILDIIGPTLDVMVGDPVDITVLFGDGDPRMDPSLDTYTATFDWDDFASSEYLVDEGVFEVIGTYVYDEPGVYVISITIVDDNGGTTSGSFLVNIIEGQLASVDAGPDATIDEGSLFVSAGGLADEDSPAYTTIVDYGDGTGPQDLPLNEGNTFTLQHQYCENGMYTVLVTAFLEDEIWGSDEAIVTVVNVPPTIISLTGPPLDPICLGTAITIVGVFTDPGSQDTHIAVIDWDDNQTTEVYLPAGVYQITSSHTYANAGVYTITLTVTDDDGGSDSMTIESYIVVYDPNCGFVTGGGWIIAQPGSYPDDPSLTGRCNFGFVSKYKKGRITPEGNTEFQFQLANLNFHSHTYEWLLISGAKARYQGVGTINGEGTYGFRLTAIDGQINGGGGIDKFRIKIWDIDNGNQIVFDNNMGQSDDADPITALAGGQITIHK